MAQAAIKQSTLDRIVSPIRRPERYKSAACRKMSSPSGDSTMGNARIDSRARRNAGSLSKPCNTSWMTGRQVTMSSKSTISSRRTFAGRRKISIHTEVSTRTTAPFSIDRFVFAHDAQIAVPQPGTRQLQNLSRLGALHHLAQRPFDSARVRSFAADAGGFVEQRLVKHKISTFHTHEVYHTQGDDAVSYA